MTRPAPIGILSEEDVKTIHAAALQLLQHTGQKLLAGGRVTM